MPKCPKCGAEMKKRNGKYGPFWGCTQYPKCKGSRKIRKRTPKSHLAKDTSKKKQALGPKSRLAKDQTISHDVSPQASTDSPSKTARKFRKRKSGFSVFQISKYIRQSISFSHKREKPIRRRRWAPNNRLVPIPISIIVILAICGGIVTFWPHAQKLLPDRKSTLSVSQTKLQPTQRLADRELVLETCTLIDVIDGDTLKIKWRNEVCSVRLLCINTPEKDEFGYNQATNTLASLVQNKNIYLEFEHPRAYRRDLYNRLLAYVHAEDKNVNIEIVRAGWSTYWIKYGKGKYEKAFFAAEKEAWDMRRGTWKSRK